MEINNPQEMYEEYRRKFAEVYHHSIEKATECQSVRLYKNYLERLYNVKIDEKRDN